MNYEESEYDKFIGICLIVLSVSLFISSITMLMDNTLIDNTPEEQEITVLGLNDIENSSKAEAPDITYEDYDVCNDLDLIATSKCLVNMTKGIYNYTRQFSWYSDFETLKEQGGDCKNWSGFYKNELEKRGFHTKLYSVPRHVFVITSNFDGYCIIDLQKINCVRYAPNPT